MTQGTQATEAMGQLISLIVDLLVGQLLFLTDERYCIRGALYLLLKKLVQTQILRLVILGCVPFHQQLLAFRLREQGYSRQFLLRISHQLLQNRLHMQE